MDAVDFVNRDYQFFESLDSTNAYCSRHADELAPGAVVAAGHQTAGRGRRGRSWHSPSGANIYASIIVEAPRNQAGIAAILQITSLSIYGTAAECGVRDTWIKWPNDIYVDHKKLAGILTENHTTPSGGRYLIVGFGVNVNMERGELAVIDTDATSIRNEIGREIDCHELLVSIIDLINDYHRTWRDGEAAAIYQEWRARSRLIGAEASIVVNPETELTGRVLDLDRDGSIRMQLHSGECRRFLNGDVSLRVRRETS